MGKPPGAPAAFVLRGYEYTPAALTSNVQYEFPFDPAHGLVRDIATLENVFFVARPNQLGGIELSSIGPEVAFVAPLIGQPVTTLDGFVLTRSTAPPATSFDAFVGSDFETSWFDVINGASNARRRIALSGQVASWAPTPFFAVVDEKAAVVTSILANEVCYVDYSIVNPGRQKRCRIVERAPVGVTASIDRAWVITTSPNRALRYFLPSLEVAEEIDLPGAPVAVTGGTLAPGILNPGGGCVGTLPLPQFHVAIALREATGTKVRAYPGGNLTAPASAIRVHDFEGVPVTMSTASLLEIEFGWLATKQPNRLYRFVISNVSGPRQTIELDASEPVRLSVGATGGVSGAPGDARCFDVGESIGAALSSGTLHVLLQNP